MRPLLTVIIPFKNEGQEVYSTVKSLLEQAGQEVNLILINDASDDGFNYKAIAHSFGAVYIEHTCSLGVAKSREDGIALCETEYFIIFDAHMRAFTKNWASLLLSCLQEDKRTVFCCATLAISKENANVISDIKGYGVIINFENLSYSWNNSDDSANNTTTEIPCIMGASYASNISYWKKLRGLKGLRCYGYDEQFISIKVALEGGTCKIIKNIVFGHIFRVLKDVPYVIDIVDVAFNRLYIAELLFPREMKAILFHNIKCFSGISCFDSALKEIEKCRNEIFDSKLYFEKIFTENFSHVLRLNSIHGIK